MLLVTDGLEKSGKFCTAWTISILSVYWKLLLIKWTIVCTGPAHGLCMFAVHIHREPSVPGSHLRNHPRCRRHWAGVSNGRTAGVIDWHELHAHVSLHRVRRRSSSCRAWVWKGKPACVDQLLLVMLFSVLSSSRLCRLFISCARRFLLLISFH